MSHPNMQDQPEYSKRATPSSPMLESPSSTLHAAIKSGASATQPRANRFKEKNAAMPADKCSSRATQDPVEITPFGSGRPLACPRGYEPTVTGVVAERRREPPANAPIRDRDVRPDFNSS